MISIQQLRDSMPGISDKNITKYLPELNKSIPAYGINTPLRLAHFLAQVGHETLSFLFYREQASGEAYDTGKLATRLGNTPESDGDGQKYKGRGAIQVTGRSNYLAVSLFIFNDKRLLDHPELLELPEYGIKAACWFWSKNNLNYYADKDDILTITHKINGGTNGLDDRKIRLEKSKRAFKI